MIRVALVLASASVAGLLSAQIPPPPSAQSLNGSVSDYGTTFIFSPPPICQKCLETELGFQSLSDGRYVPAVVTVAPFASKTDFSLLVNMLDSESPGGDRATHFGNRFDFVARQQVAAKGNFTFVLAPRGAVFVRGTDGGRAGATGAPQYSWGNNLAAANFTWTGGIGVSAGNARSDYVGSFDYFRTLDKKGTALFLGFQHEVTAGQQTAGTEEGLVIPFRNGQVELETAQLDLNVKPEWQFQARVIVNWGAVFSRKQ
ncbi:MAG: hypothetical protein ABR976_22540 [Terracidiphilus sp.]